MKTVELINAFAFTCEECGRDNFCRGITIAPEEIDADSFPPVADREDVQEWLDAGDLHSLRGDVRGGNGRIVVRPARAFMHGINGGKSVASSLMGSRNLTESLTETTRNRPQQGISRLIPLCYRIAQVLGNS